MMMSQASSGICCHCAEETNPVPAGQGRVPDPRLSHCIPRCLVGDTWPGQPVTGETDRPRKSRSMEGRRGFRRLTGQKAEPPCGVKLTLLGSGQDGCSEASSWQQDLGGATGGDAEGVSSGWVAIHSFTGSHSGWSKQVNGVSEMLSYTAERKQKTHLTVGSGRTASCCCLRLKATSPAAT